ITLLNPMRVNDTIPPLETCLEPPRSPAMFLNCIRIGQAPIAKLRNQQRQIGAMFLLVVGIPNRRAAFGEFSHPLVPCIGMVRQDIVMMEIFKVTSYMSITITSRVVHNQTRWVE